GGARCTLCGPSPYPTAGPRHQIFGAGFSDWTLCEDPLAPDLCQGCAAILSGKPGRQPPPLRMRSLAVIDGALEILTLDRLWALLTTPRDGLTVLSWATSAQKHHALHAEISTPDRLCVGSDDGCIRVHRVDLAPVADAVRTLRAGDDPKKPWCTRDEILTGHYRPQSIARDPRTWERAEAVLAPRRGTLLLSLLVAHAPVAAPDESTLTETTMDDPTETAVARWLATIARDSQYRSTHGKEFWGGVFERRLRRHLTRPLPDLLSRLATDLQIPPVSEALREAHRQLTALTPDETAQWGDVLRTRTTLLVGLAFQHQRDAREAAQTAKARRSTRTTTQETP
ncbi:MAG TPA: hypothetical protein VF158_10400, partial [Longimicrobiales bacterium]